LLSRLIFTGPGPIPPATAVNFVPWAIVGFIFQYVIRRRHFSYWTKYNCGSPPLTRFCLVFTVAPSRRCALCRIGCGDGCWVNRHLLRVRCCGNCESLDGTLTSDPFIAFNSRKAVRSAKLPSRLGGGIPCTRGPWTGKHHPYENLPRVRPSGTLFSSLATISQDAHYDILNVRPATW